MSQTGFSWRGFAVAALCVVGATAAFAQPAAPLVRLNEAGFAKMLAGQKGKVTLVDFWATWCVPCRKEMPELAKLEAKWKAKGLSLVTISADEVENEAAAKAFLKQAGITGTTYLRMVKNEDAFVRTVDPKWSGELPALFLYDKSGKLIKAWRGETALSEIEAAVSKLF